MSINHTALANSFDLKAGIMERTTRPARGSWRELTLEDGLRRCPGSRRRGSPLSLIPSRRAQTEEELIEEASGHLEERGSRREGGSESCENRFNVGLLFQTLSTRSLVRECSRLRSKELSDTREDREEAKDSSRIVDWDSND